MATGKQRARCWRRCDRAGTQLDPELDLGRAFFAMSGESGKPLPGNQQFPAKPAASQKKEALRESGRAPGFSPRAGSFWETARHLCKFALPENSRMRGGSELRSAASSNPV